MIFWTVDIIWDLTLAHAGVNFKKVTRNDISVHTRVIWQSTKSIHNFRLNRQLVLQSCRALTQTRSDQLLWAQAHRHRHHYRRHHYGQQFSTCQVLRHLTSPQPWPETTWMAVGLRWRSTVAWQCWWQVARVSARLSGLTVWESGTAVWSPRCLATKQTKEG